MYFGLVVDVDLVQNKLVRLEFEIKLEPLLLSHPTAAPAAPPDTPPPPLC